MGEKETTPTIRKRRRGQRLNKEELAYIREELYTHYFYGDKSINMLKDQVFGDVRFDEDTWNKHAKIMEPEIVRDFEQRFNKGKILRGVLDRKILRRQIIEAGALAETNNYNRSSGLQQADKIDDSIVRLMQDLGVIPKQLGHLDTTTVLADELSADQKALVMKRIEERVNK